MGELAEARLLLEAAGEQALACGMHPVLGDCLAGLAEAALLREDGPAAREAINGMAELAVSLGSTWLIAAGRLMSARLSRFDADLETAHQLCHEAVLLHAEHGYRLGALSSLEELAGLRTATGALLEAARLFAAITAARRHLGLRRRPVDIARHRADWATISKAVDADALRQARRAGAALSLDDTIALVSRGRGARRRPRTGWSSLTPTELTVVRHIAEGRTNQEIARRMFLSTGTVKAHLTHIFAKLGAANRAQVAAEAAGHGG